MSSEVTPDRKIPTERIKITPEILEAKAKLYKSPNTNQPQSKLPGFIGDLYENYFLWKLLHKQGILDCYQIEQIKIGTFTSSEPPTRQKHFPDDLQPICDSLKTITKSMKEITERSHKLDRIIQATIQLSENDGNPNQKLLPVILSKNKFYEMLGVIFKNYLNQLKLYDKVSETISHCINYNQLVTTTSIWEFPQFVNDRHGLIIFKLMDAFNLAGKREQFEENVKLRYSELLNIFKI